MVDENITMHQIEWITDISYAEYLLSWFQNRIINFVFPSPSGVAFLPDRVKIKQAAKNHPDWDVRKAAKEILSLFEEGKIWTNDIGLEWIWYELSELLHLVSALKTKIDELSSK